MQIRTAPPSQSPREECKPKSKAHLPFFHETGELSHQYSGVILSYFQQVQRKKAKTEFSNCGYTKLKLLVHTLWALV